MGNKLIVRFRRVFDGNRASDSKTKSITANDNKNLNYPTIEIECNQPIVDNLGNFTRSASGSIRSSKVLPNTVSFFTLKFVNFFMNMLVTILFCWIFR